MAAEAESVIDPDVALGVIVVAVVLSGMNGPPVMVTSASCQLTDPYRVSVAIFLSLWVM